MFVLPFLSLLLATTGFAAPPRHGRGGASVPGSVLQSELPANQTALVAPNSPARFVAVGTGLQNYTCTSAGNYSSIGAVAQLFDISGLNGGPEFDTIQECVYNNWVADPDSNPLDGGLVSQVTSQFGLPYQGLHTFTNFNGASDPKFDFTQSTGNSNDFIIAAKSGDIPPPGDTSKDVDWLFLTNLSGGLANQVFRVQTVGGKQPSSCTPGSGVITVKYAAKYWFF